jgi:hypothetical protein
MQYSSASNFAQQVQSYCDTGNYGASQPGDRVDTRSRHPSAGLPDSQLRDFAEAAYTRPRTLDGYSLVPALSSGEVSVYVNLQLKQAVVTVRGTAKANDIVTDGAVAAGMLHRTPRFRRTSRQVGDAVASLGGYTGNMTGHSLGGSVVNELSQRMPKRRAVAFNTGYSVPSINSCSRGSQDCAYTEYLNKYDCVSAGARLGRKKRAHTEYYANNRYFLRCSQSTTHFVACL